MLKFKKLLTTINDIFSKKFTFEIDGDNLLILAVRNNQLESVKLLLNVNMNMHVMDNDMHTPFRYCVKYNNIEIKNLLLTKANSKDLKSFQEQISHNIQMLVIPEHIRLYFLSELDKFALKLDLETEFTAKKAQNKSKNKL